MPPFQLWTFMCDLSPKLEAQIRLQTGQTTVVSEEAAEGLSFTAARLSSLVFRLVCSDSLTFLLMVVLHFALSAACFSHVSESILHFFRLAFRLSRNFGLPVPLFPLVNSP